jgi:D-sedoheptulose 7-phosphate isomerase
MNSLHLLAESRFQQSIDMPLRFFEAEAERVSQACLAMARRFHRNGRLLAFGAGNAVTDAQHVSVEFVHPVIVGKRALPAIALGTDMAATVGLAMGAGWEQTYARQLDALGRSEDIALGIDATGNDTAVLTGLTKAAEKGMLTIGLTGGDGGGLATTELDFCFVIPTGDTAVIQETHETLYHIFWELVHVFFEHKGLLSES